jgi:hypothetical protein
VSIYPSGFEEHCWGIAVASRCPVVAGLRINDYRSFHQLLYKIYKTNESKIAPLPIPAPA